VAARERKLGGLPLERLLVVAVVGDVLAEALVAAAAEAHDGRPPCELARDLRLETLELVGLDLQRQGRNTVVGRHVPAERYAL
jgi:hypothetical protein